VGRIDLVRRTAAVTLLVGVLAAVAVAAGYACVGALALGWSSHGAAALSASFLIGAGICAAVLFPLSLLAPSHALDAELVLLVFAAGIAAGRRWTARHESRPPSESATRSPADPVARVLLSAVVGLTLFFAVYNIWDGNSWDGVQVFGTRAEMLFHQGGLSRWWFPEDAYDTRLLAYPPMISLAEALVSRIQGAFDFDRLKPIFFFFYLSLLVSTYAAARRLVSRRWALAATLLVALLPEISFRSASGGYVDMPMAAFVAAAVAAALQKDDARHGWRSPLPWLLGAMTATKQEGMLLAIIACGAVASCWLGERPRRIAERLRANVSGMIVVAAFVAARVGYVRWTRVHDATWGPFDAAHVARALKSMDLVISLCLRYMFTPFRWGLFWPAFFVAAIGVAASGPARVRLLALTISTAAALEAGLFLFTNWDFQAHIEGAYSRLLAQLAPAAAVVIVFAASRIWLPPAESPAAMPAGRGLGL
jgi:Dolichyl-phosphate-mannose-protein mannosyltransferase